MSEEFLSKWKPLLKCYCPNCEAWMSGTRREEMHARRAAAAVKPEPTADEKFIQDLRAEVGLAMADVRQLFEGTVSITATLAREKLTHLVGEVLRFCAKIPEESKGDDEE